MVYAELHCLSNFTFLRGASHPHELVERAAELGYRALALTDECSMAGVVRAHVAARELSLCLLIGSEFTLADGLRVVLLARNRAGYSQLCELITRARRAAPKGRYRVVRMDLETDLGDCLALYLPGREPDLHAARFLSECFPGRAWLAVELLATGDDRSRLRHLETIATAADLPMVAAGDVHMHRRSRRALQDAMTAIRLGLRLDQAGCRLYSNGERHLRSLAELQKRYPAGLLQASVDIAACIDFSLDELRYEYPQELVPAGESPASHLRNLTWAGARQRWPDGVPARVRQLIERELRLIAELEYEAYFLTVHDIVRFARNRGILCQGRGSAANSAVCFCLGITAVDPARMSMLMERFISKERNEPPDIDVDFEHERREEVMQYIYRKYGRSRAALTASVIRYRPRSAIRDIGKVLGLEKVQIDRIAGAVQWWDGLQLQHEQLCEAGLDPDAPLLHRLLELANELVGFPRHLSQHVGGFVISHGKLSKLVPVENAAMKQRTVIQWDKDDLDELGLLKIDVLALGMLSAIRRCLDLIRKYHGRPLELADIPAGDPAVYDMICQADTTGVFQIESRAQMAMLPRLRPRCYYDLVIQIAIIRPGPIQGDMVHPYLRRRNGEEPVSYPGAAVRGVLERTLGVPIFQEQVMQLAIVAAGFSPGEADELRRAMAAWHRRGQLEAFEGKLLAGMQQRGYSDEFAGQIIRQIRGFGEYGFPESHAASFALLAYVSAWLKCHYPAAFFCALLNSQPMGFYAPAQLLQCARRHAVTLRPVDVLCSRWDCGLEPDTGAGPALRLGLRMVKGLPESAAMRILAWRKQHSERSVQSLQHGAGLNRKEMAILAAADALQSLAGHRHRAAWQVAGVEPSLPLFGQLSIVEAEPLLHRATEGEEIAADYRYLGLSLRRHPLALLRDGLQRLGIFSAQEVACCSNGVWVQAAGLVIVRQRPGSAGGVVFVSLEDETGNLNVIVRPQLLRRQRRELLGARLLAVSGKVQRQGKVLHLMAHRVGDLSHLLGKLQVASRDFH